MTAANGLSMSLVVLDQDGALNAVTEMSLASWVLAGRVPGIGRNPLGKQGPDPRRCRSSFTVGGTRPPGPVAVSPGGIDRAVPDRSRCLGSGQLTAPRQTPTGLRVEPIRVTLNSQEGLHMGNPS